jgi:uncharacterized protein YbjQ (UPF0145 family)
MFKLDSKIKDMLLLIFSVMTGLWVGMIVMLICTYYHLYIFGVNLDIFIAPLVAGFVETFVSNLTRKKSSGAISAIILFFITNGIGWLFPKTPLTFNIFTVGGFLLMLQAAFPLAINYLIIAIVFAVTYLFGLFGSFIGIKLQKNNSPVLTVSNLEESDVFGIHIFNSKPDLPIEKYHGLVFAEDVIEFEDKKIGERIGYIGSNMEQKQEFKYNDYSVSRRYILHLLEEEAKSIGANAIIDIEFEYTKYNQQLPPDVIVAAYGTAVTIDPKYLNI